MTYEEFKAEMQRLLNKAFQYTCDQVGSGHYVEKMADLAEIVPSRLMAEKLAEHAELRKVKKDFEEVLGHLRKLVYENGSRKIDMRAEVINILAEYE